MGWFPAYDPDGTYRAKLIDEGLEDPLLEIFESREKGVVTEYINEAMRARLGLLSKKREQSEREHRRQARLRQQRDLRA